MTALQWDSTFQTALWTAGANTTFTPNSTTAPDGTQTAGLLVDSTTSAVHSLASSQSFATTNTLIYNCSFFAKQAAGSSLLIQCTGSQTNAAFGGGYANFTLTGNGAATSGGTVVGAAITAYPNGWYRCSLQLTAGATTTSQGFFVTLQNSSGNTRSQAYAGTGTGVYIWGMMVEVAPNSAFLVPSSYIPCGAAANVTRAADVITVTPGGALANIITSSGAARGCSSACWGCCRTHRPFSGLTGRRYRRCCGILPGC